MVFLLAGFAYLCGSIPSGVWIGRLFYNKDIRQFGSGNSGATNTFRVLGRTAGIIVTLMDIFKGFLPTLIASTWVTDAHPLLIGICAVLGHTYPLFARFKGGKAVATTAGVLLAYHALFVFSGMAVFATILYLTSIVSFTSITTCLLMTGVSFFLGDWALSVTAIVLTAFIIFRHRSNIQRLLQGTESTVPFGFHCLSKKK